MFRAVTGRASEQVVLRATVSGGGAVQGAETAPWPWGPAPRWQSRPHLRPALVPTSSLAQVPSLAWYSRDHRFSLKKAEKLQLDVGSLVPLS